MTRLLKRSLAVVLGPALRWISRQLADIAARVDRVLASQDELLSLNRAALRERDAGLELVSRSVAVQTASLEAVADAHQRLAEEQQGLAEGQQRLTEGQQRLAEELASLRELLEARPPAPAELERTAPEPGNGG